MVMCISISISRSNDVTVCIRGWGYIEKEVAVVVNLGAHVQWVRVEKHTDHRGQQVPQQREGGSY